MKWYLLLITFLIFNVNAAIEFTFKTTTLVSGLQKPWGMTTLPNGDLVITERNGQLRRWNGKSLSAKLVGLPEVLYIGQGGLLDVKAHPDFANNHWLYFTYSASRPLPQSSSPSQTDVNLQQSSNSQKSNKNGTHLARAKLVGNTLSQIEVLFSPRFMKSGGYHFAGRIEFLPDNTLIFGVGDGYSYKDHAQDLTSDLGKLIRLKDDGSIPTDNPFVKKANRNSEIYSYGHRNPQGLSFDVKRNILFSNEHGPKGGDEVNIIKPSLNYGWPEITYGVDYSGEIISEDSSKEGMQQPLVNWTPSIAPSSILVYYGKAFPQLNGHLLNTTLKYQELRLVELANTGDASGEAPVKVVSQSSYLKNLGERFRDIELDKQGNIYLLTDSGKLIKLER
jgi:glucose/arabinose dehydrogenase